MVHAEPKIRKQVQRNLHELMPVAASPTQMLALSSFRVRTGCIPAGSTVGYSDRPTIPLEVETEATPRMETAQR